MTYKEQQQKLFTAVQLLMELYQELSLRAEPLSFARNSELKKIPRITF